MTALLIVFTACEICLILAIFHYNMSLEDKLGASFILSILMAAIFAIIGFVIDSSCSIDMFDKSNMDDEKIATIVSLEPNKIEINFGSTFLRECEVLYDGKLLAPMDRRTKTINVWNAMCEKEKEQRRISYDQKLDNIIKRNIEQ